VTSSSAHLDEPLAGSVFAFRPDVPGVPVGGYRG
jgi:hypothetical protein